MAVSINIRQVERPKNTIVDDSGRDGPNRYAVRERASTKYVAGGNPQPRNGRVIGHIIDFRFVPVQEKTASQGPDMLSYGASALVKSVTADILADLLDVYPAQDAYAIMAIATLRVIRPAIACSRLSTHYNRTFVRVDYPGELFPLTLLAGFCKGLARTARSGSCFTKSGWPQLPQTTISRLMAH